jgi:hypothetical protein
VVRVGRRVARVLTRLVQYMTINVVKMLPAASGGGRFVILSVVTNTKRELAFKMTMDALMNWTLLEKGALALVAALYGAHHGVPTGIKLQPAFITSDQDLATRNAVCYALNGCSLVALRERLHRGMLEGACVLMEHDLLGKPLDVNNPPEFPLPYPGFELAPGELRYCACVAPAVALTARRADGTVMPTPVDGVTLPLLCTAHFGRTDRDHILYRGTDFQQLTIKGTPQAAQQAHVVRMCIAFAWACARACVVRSHLRPAALSVAAHPPSLPPPPYTARHFYVHLSACFLYPALASPLFSGMHTYPFLLMYEEEVEAILSLGPVRAREGGTAALRVGQSSACDRRCTQVLPVGEVFYGLILRAHVREATADDQKPKRKAFTHVFEAVIKGIAAPICTVRIRGMVGASAQLQVRCCAAADGPRVCYHLRNRAGDAEQEVELDMPPETADMVRAVHLGALPKAADAYADVPTDELDQQEGYVRPEGAEPADSGSDSESEEAEPESLPLPAPLDGDEAGGVHVFNPLHLERKMKKEVRALAAPALIVLSDASRRPGCRWFRAGNCAPRSSCSRRPSSARTCRSWCSKATLTHRWRGRSTT